MILQALKGYYDRERGKERPTVPDLGYSFEQIDAVLVLARDGSPIEFQRLPEGRYLVPLIERTSGIKPKFLWDNTSYVLGVSEKSKRVEREHAAFNQLHLDVLNGTRDDGLKAVARFLAAWHPKLFGTIPGSGDALDRNLVFKLDGERSFIHERGAARELWLTRFKSQWGALGLCLVTGTREPIASLHPSVGGVRGAQSSGAYVVSFNADAYESYGRKSGANAPVSELAAFEYTAALGTLLAKGSRNRVQIGDATTVFWAEADDPAQAEAGENLVAALFSPPDDGPADDDASATAKLGDVVKAMAAGRPLADASPGLAADARFYLLGLSPNAARISVRFWHATTLGNLSAAFQQHWQDMRIDQPPARGKPPSVPACVLMTAPARKDRQGRVKFAFDDISPLLGGELMRAILTQGRYPSSLLANLVMRVRSDGALTRLRVALIKACIVRGMRLDGRLPKEDYLVRSDPDDPNPARRLGRLFALIERAQLAALGDDINATIKDKYIGAAAATPAQVFNGRVKNSFHHTGRLRRGHSEAKWVKNPKPVGMAIERDIGRLWATFDSGLPKQHTTEEQGLFFVGYFQERYGGKADPNVGAEPGVDTPDDSDDTDQE